MADAVETFKQKMLTDNDARNQFASSVKEALKKQGVDVNNPDVLKTFGLHADQIDAGSISADSTVIITLVM